MIEDATLPQSQNNFDVYWRRWTLLLWLLAAAVMLWLRRTWIAAFLLPDTDDNIRMMQVRGLLNGQGWYDLRQYALNPPFGANIHWSRIVDLPIAGIILAFRPFVGNMVAEHIACAVAPILPLSLALLGMGALARKLVAPLAYPLACVLTLCGFTAMGMFMPMRIDHHGWQLAMLVLTLAGLVDERRIRSGVLIGLTSAISLNIGLEMIPFLALAGGLVVVRWVVDAAERERMKAYGLALALGCGLGYLAFASNDNSKLMCDVLSPVWLSMMVSAGAILVGMALIPARAVWIRVGLTALAAAVLAWGFDHFWPQCLGRPEHVSPEVYTIWLSNVREAKPLLTQSTFMIISILALPVMGVIGTLVGLWRARKGGHLAEWAMVALFTLAAFAFLLWQTRFGPATQLIAVPGATILCWLCVKWVAQIRFMAVRIVGIVSVFLLASGIGTEIVAALTLDKPANKSASKTTAKPVVKAKDISAQCSTQAAMAPLNLLPPATIFTHVDLGPRLITLTHHRAIAGPYHRNGDAILDVYHAFGDQPDQARAIMARHGATLLLTCPHMSETTIYHARWPGGLYDQLEQGHYPAWLTRMPLPAGSPFKLWAIAPTPQETKK